MRTEYRKSTLLSGDMLLQRDDFSQDIHSHGFSFSVENSLCVDLFSLKLTSKYGEKA